MTSERRRCAVFLRCLLLLVTASGPALAQPVGTRRAPDAVPLRRPGGAILAPPSPGSVSPPVEESVPAPDVAPSSNESATTSPELTPLAGPAELLRSSTEQFELRRREAAQVAMEVGAANAAIEKKTSAPRSGLLALPVIFYAPETDLGLGAFGLYYFHIGEARKTRASSVRSSATFTTRGQLLFDVGPDLWLASDALHVDASGFARYYPDSFNGIGNNTTPEDRESFTDRSFVGQLRVQIRTLPKLYAGFVSRLEYRDILDKEPGRKLAAGNIPGSAGGAVFGGGPAITYDSRDSTYAASRGMFVDLTFQGFSKALGGNYDFGAARMDVRKYVALGDEVLAFQAVGQLAAGDPPFYLLSRIGGAAFRGVSLGRVRDNHMIEAQAEFRFPIFGRFGGTSFIGAGQVAHSVVDFAPKELRYGGGAGLRYAIVPAEKINIRLDFAYVSGLAYYLDIGEAF